MIKRFHVIEDSIAIIRLKGGVQKQVKLYRRGSSVFIPHGGGYLRVVYQMGERFGTDNPDLFVLELEGPQVTIKGRVPFYEESYEEKRVS